MHLARAAAIASEAWHSISFRRVLCRASYIIEMVPKVAVPIAIAAERVISRTAPGFPSMTQARPGAGYHPVPMRPRLVLGQ
jgi:hypothetical protein